MNPTRGNSSPAYNSTEALGHIGDVRAVEPPVKALQHDNYGYVRRAATRALGSIGDARAVEPLTAALKDEDMDVRKEAEKTLKKLGAT
jgi:HEAT repeat protein